jgi:hypothetical protein
LKAVEKLVFVRARGREMEAGRRKRVRRGKGG